MACQRANKPREQYDAVWPVGALDAVAASDRGKRRFTAWTTTQIHLATPPRSPPPVIPDELIADILNRVPVKSLLRFRCVCKSWKSLISDRQFAKTHLRRSTMDISFTNHRLVPQACFLRDDVVSCSLESLYNKPSTVPESLWYPLKPEYDVVGYCNGLVCLVWFGGNRTEKRVRLWNPCTKLMSQESPSLFNRASAFDCHKPAFGFGYDESSDTYKVVSVFCEPVEKSSVNVFSFGTKNSWRQVESFPAVTFEWGKSAQFVRGTVNWLAHSNAGLVYVDPYEPNHVKNYYVIVSFDLGRETSRELLLPDDIDRRGYVPTTLGVLRDCLCISQNCTHFVVWQMEHGVKESWTRLLTISYQDLGVGFHAYLEPMCMSEKGDILLTTNVNQCKVVIYNPRCNRLERHAIQSNKSWIHSKVYVESLVSPPC